MCVFWYVFLLVDRVGLLFENTKRHFFSLVSFCPVKSFLCVLRSVFLSFKAILPVCFSEPIRLAITSSLVGR